MLAAIAGLVYGGLFALANFVTPAPHEISQPVKLPKAAK